MSSNNLKPFRANVSSKWIKWLDLLAHPPPNRTIISPHFIDYLQKRYPL